MIKSDDEFPKVETTRREDATLKAFSPLRRCRNQRWTAMRVRKSGGARCKQRTEINPS